MAVLSSVGDAIPTRREGDGAFLGVSLVAFLLFILIGMHPFTQVYAASADMSGEGDPVRRLILLVLLVLLTPFALGRWRRIAAVAAGIWMLLAALAWCFVSVSWAYAEAVSLRRILGTLVILGILLITGSLPHKRMRRSLQLATGIVMSVNLIGILLVPGLAISVEGHWKGLHDHKNTAGYVAALAIICWSGLDSGRARAAKYLFLTACAVFLVFTGSKTSIGIVGLVTAVQFIVRRFLIDPRAKQSILALSAAALVVLAPLALLFVDYVVRLISGQSFTGRTAIWDFVWQKVQEKPLLGWGYASFWGLGKLSLAAREASWQVSQYTQAHNGYLDTLVSVGVIGLSLTIAALAHSLIAAVTVRSRLNVEVADSIALGVGLVLFGILHNLMETSLLMGLNPVWVFTMAGMIIIRASLVETGAGMVRT